MGISYFLSAKGSKTCQYLPRFSSLLATTCGWAPIAWVGGNGVGTKKTRQHSFSSLNRGARTNRTDGEEVMMQEDHSTVRPN